MLAMENWMGQSDLKVAEIIDSLPENLLSSNIQNANPSMKVSRYLFSQLMTPKKVPLKMVKKQRQVGKQAHKKLLKKK